MFLISTVAIAGIHGAALGAGRHTNLAMAEYWRWWVVHLWVEGFFEVFATVVVAFLFARLRLVSLELAGEASLLSATIFLSGGIIGTLHHLYFTGTPTVALALGSVFSALEVVPLLFVGYEAWASLKLSRATAWTQKYRWPIYFFIAVAFWNPRRSVRERLVGGSAPASAGLTKSRQPGRPARPPREKRPGFPHFPPDFLRARALPCPPAEVHADVSFLADS